MWRNWGQELTSLKCRASALFCFLWHRRRSPEGAGRGRSFSLLILTVSLFIVTFFSQITQNSPRVFSLRYDARNEAHHNISVTRGRYNNKGGGGEGEVDATSLFIHPSLKFWCVICFVASLDIAICIATAFWHASQVKFRLFWQNSSLFPVFLSSITELVPFCVEMPHKKTQKTSYLVILWSKLRAIYWT